MFLCPLLLSEYLPMNLLASYNILHPPVSTIMHLFHIVTGCGRSVCSLVSIEFPEHRRMLMSMALRCGAESFNIVVLSHSEPVPDVFALK